MRRRTLLGGIGSMVMLAPLAGCRPWLKRDPRPTTAGAHQRATVAAMAETFIPSADGSPGAREADAISLILDPQFPVYGYLDELTADLDDWCRFSHGGRTFLQLGPGEREHALEQRMGMRGKMIRSWYLPVYEGVLVLTKLAFFGGLRRPVGTTFVGFPGASAGYHPRSAAGVHAARSGSGLAVDGEGTVTGVWVTALIAGFAGDGVDLARARSLGDLDAADPGLRLTTPAGEVHAVPPTAGLAAPLAADRTAVPAAAGAVARGTWQLSAGPGAVVTAWWLALRTDLDEPRAET